MSVVNLVTPPSTPGPEPVALGHDDAVKRERSTETMYDSDEWVEVCPPRDQSPHHTRAKDSRFVRTCLCPVSPHAVPGNERVRAREVGRRRARSEDAGAVEPEVEEGGLEERRDVPAVRQEAQERGGGLARQKTTCRAWCRVFDEGVQNQVRFSSSWTAVRLSWVAPRWKAYSCHEGVVPGSKPTSGTFRGKED